MYFESMAAQRRQRSVGQWWCFGFSRMRDQQRHEIFAKKKYEIEKFNSNEGFEYLRDDFMNNRASTQVSSAKL